ncbi:MAG: hypothetical protein KJZ65_09110 [Phycisphaerales bacterium]|nr:hypothetical protein [Phycisphaerales bacterium]
MALINSGPRHPEVRFPDRMGIVVPGADYQPEDYDTRLIGWERWRIGFVDGSVRTVAQSELLPGYSTGEHPFGSGASMLGFPVIHTIDGVRGRDAK